MIFDENDSILGQTLERNHSEKKFESKCFEVFETEQNLMNGSFCLFILRRFFQENLQPSLYHSMVILVFTESTRFQQIQF